MDRAELVDVCVCVFLTIQRVVYGAQLRYIKMSSFSKNERGNSTSDEPGIVWSSIDALWAEAKKE